MVSRLWKVSKTHEPSFEGGKVIPSASGKFFVCWCKEDVKLLDIESGEVKASIKADEDDGFSSFALHPRDQFLVTASSRSNLLKRWDLQKKEAVNVWAGHKLPVMDIAYDSTGTYVATASIDRSVRVWNASQGFATHSFKGHRTPVRRVAWHPDPKRLLLVSSAEDGEVRVWNLETRECHVLENHMSEVPGVTFSHDGWTMVSGGRDKVVSIWDLKKFSLISTIPLLEPLESVVMLPLGWTPSQQEKQEKKQKPDNTEYFASGGESGQIRVWNLKTSKCVYSHLRPVHFHGVAKEEEERDDPSTALTQLLLINPLPITPPYQLNEDTKESDEPSGDSKEKVKKGNEHCQLVAVTQEHNFYIYNLNTFEKDKLLIGNNDELTEIRCHPDNERAVLATNSSQVRIFNLATLDFDLLDAHQELVLSLDLSVDGKYLVTSSKDRTVRFWQLDPVIRLLSVCEGHTEAVAAVRFSRQLTPGAHLFAISGSRDRTLKFWDCTPLEKLRQTDSLTQVRILPAVSTLAHDKDINTIAVSPNSKLIATGSQDKLIKIWSSVDGLKPLATLKGHRRGVWSVEFSPIDQVLASSSGDKTIKLWSMADFSCLKTLEGHQQSVLRVVFVNRGTQLLSAGSDAVLKLWIIKTSECANTFSEPHEGKIWAMAVTPDEKRLVTGASDGLLNVWSDVTQKEIDEKAAESKARVAKEQVLLNAVRRRNYKRAVVLALELDQPRRLLNIFSDLLRPHTLPLDKKTPQKPIYPPPEPDSEEEDQDVLRGEDELVNIFETLSKEQITMCLKYARDWNTNAKNCLLAHQVVGCIFRVVPPSHLKDCSGIKDIIDSLVSYTQRHAARLDRLLQKSFLLDYTFRRLELLELEMETTHEPSAELPIQELMNQKGIQEPLTTKKKKRKKVA